MEAFFWASCIFDYQAVEETELSVTKGDKIFIEEQNDSGWSLARLGDKSGWIPTDYVEKLAEQPPPPPMLESEPFVTEQVAVQPVVAIQQPVSSQPPQPQPTVTKTSVSSSNNNNYSSNSFSQPVSVPVANKSSGGGGGGDVKICAGCHNVVDSAFVIAKEKAFHLACFTCAECKSSLGGQAFIEKDGKQFCEKCYYNAFNPKCARCNETIKGQYVSALGKSWHPEHFTCTDCGKEFIGNQFHKHNDMPYCEKHYQEKYGEQCSKCHKKILGQVFEALDRKYHLDCFTCAEGNHIIGEGSSFQIHQDQIYCVEHFEAKFLQVCQGCKQIIRGQYVKVMDAHFHPNCWKCASCETGLTSDNVARAPNGSFYCKNCINKASVSGPGPSVTPVVNSKPIEVKVADNKASPPSSGGLAKDQTPAMADGSQAKPSSYDGASGLPRFPLAVLKSDLLPPGVDKAQKEKYLDDKDFQRLFAMDRAAFDKQAAWKKNAAKKAAGLF